MLSWFRGFRLKMLCLISVSVFTLAGLSVYVFFEIDKLGRDIADANEVQVPFTRFSNQMESDINGISKSIWQEIVFSDPGQLKSGSNKTVEFIQEFESDLQATEKYAEDDLSKTKLDDIKKTWLHLKPAFEKAHTMASVDPTVESKAGALQVMTGHVSQLVQEIDEDIKEMNIGREKALNEDTERENREVKRTKEVFTLVSLFASFFVGGLGLLIAIRLSAVLNRVIGELTHHSQEVSMASAGLSSAANSLSTGATETASSLEETVASTEELTGMVRRNADNAKQAARLASDGKITAETGQGHISSLHEAVSEVSKASKEIVQITVVIDDIAFQTNLLALNAAVEAARAGEQGKGFAVVADGVRSLAQRSAVAAKEISKLIRESVSKIENSHEFAQKSKASLATIVHSIHQMSDITSEFASASEDQAVGLSAISQAMNQIDQATQLNAASSEEVSATSEELTSQSHALQNLVAELKAIVDGKGREAGTSPSQVTPVSPKFSQPPPSKLTGPGLNTQTQLESVLPFGTGSDRQISKVEGF